VFCQGNEQALLVVQKLCTWFFICHHSRETLQQQEQQQGAAGLEACDPWPGTGAQQQQRMTI
jgi:hypothetical protein